ncbi:MAG TPA: hypothetical protein VJQ06_00335 [Rhizomicrobium sp.]|jgi:hypothetical protein|nr:hypothetical protein [Rhizomicrobium sp.]
MRVEQVEIYSDTTNRAILRHPGRKFPGILIQGDTLHGLCREADEACEGARASLDDENYSALNELRNALWDYLAHYKNVLIEHDIELPFNDKP